MPLSASPALRPRRLKEKDNLRERLADAEDRGIPLLIFFGDQELAKARPAVSRHAARRRPGGSAL